MIIEHKKGRLVVSSRYFLKNTNFPHSLSLSFFDVMHVATQSECVREAYSVEGEKERLRDRRASILATLTIVSGQRIPN